MSFQLFNNEYPSRVFELFSPNDRMMYLNQLREFYRAGALWNWNLEQNYNQQATIKRTKDKFQINVDVNHFSPDEISVKVLDGYVLIEARHEEKRDEHGYITRQFTRKYCLPEGYNADLVESKLSSDGILSVIVQKFSTEAKNVRAIPIVQTGPVRKENFNESTQLGFIGAEK